MSAWDLLAGAMCTTRPGADCRTRLKCSNACRKGASNKWPSTGSPHCVRISGVSMPMDGP
eukprot:1454000-Amphidinium_carterae.1